MEKIVLFIILIYIATRLEQIRALLAAQQADGARSSAEETCADAAEAGAEPVRSE